MTETPLTSCAELAVLLQDGTTPLIFDCSFDLMDPESGPWAYTSAHLPGARYLHLEHDLSAPRNGRNGRHPLPERAVFAERMANLGVDDESLVIAYDNAANVYASRLWWMLRWCGHRNARVLDGGTSVWSAGGYPVERGEGSSSPRRGSFQLQPSLMRTEDYSALLEGLPEQRQLIVDARAPDRYRGDVEPFDPVAGHIPGALSRSFRENLQANGCFKPPAVLRDEWLALLGGRSIGELVTQCGSGVTACHHLLALEIAGLAGAALYPGSWSEWCTQPGAPVATGAEP